MPITRTIEDHGAFAQELLVSGTIVQSVFRFTVAGALVLALSGMLPGAAFAQKAAAVRAQATVVSGAPAAAATETNRQIVRLRDILDGADLSVLQNVATRRGVATVSTERSAPDARPAHQEPLRSEESRGGFVITVAYTAN
jgi:hypothetical protein